MPHPEDDPEYAGFADRLVQDDSADFPGPLAGILAGLDAVRTTPGGWQEFGLAVGRHREAQARWRRALLGSDLIETVRARAELTAAAAEVERAEAHAEMSIGGTKP